MYICINLLRSCGSGGRVSRLVIKRLVVRFLTPPFYFVEISLSEILNPKLLLSTLLSVCVDLCNE